MTFYDDFGDPEWTGSPVPRALFHRRARSHATADRTDNPRLECIINSVIA